jgi:Protein of unknown function (DUF2442)
MLVDVSEVRWLGGHRLRVGFTDGSSGEVDLANHLSFSGVFAPLRDPARFGEVVIDPEAGTIKWPNGADVDPIVLWHWTTGKPLPDWADRGRASGRRSARRS